MIAIKQYIRRLKSTLGGSLGASLYGYSCLVIIFYIFHGIDIGISQVIAERALLPFVEAASIYVMSVCLVVVIGLLFSVVSKRGVVDSLKTQFSKINIFAFGLFIVVMAIILLPPQ